MVYGCISPELGIFFSEILEGWFLYWPDAGFFLSFCMGLYATCSGLWRGVPPEPQHAVGLPVDHGVPGERRTEDLCSLLPDGSQRPLQFLLRIPAGLNITICRFQVRWHHCISHTLTARLKPLMLACSLEVEPLRFGLAGLPQGKDCHATPGPSPLAVKAFVAWLFHLVPFIQQKHRTCLLCNGHARVSGVQSLLC